MNVRILVDVMVVQRRNDQKVINRARAKARPKWDKLVIIIEKCSPLPKPTFRTIITSVGS